MGENGGLTIERHYVTTKDGYILGLYRIVGPKNRDLDDGKPSRPMLFMHGMVILLLLVIGTAFIGYVLPWGQISFCEKLFLNFLKE